MSLHPRNCGNVQPHTLIGMQHCSTPLTLQEGSHKHGHTENCQYENSYVYSGFLGLTRPLPVVTHRTYCTVQASLVTAECNDLLCTGSGWCAVSNGSLWSQVSPCRPVCYRRRHPALTEPRRRGAAAGAAQALPPPPACQADMRHYLLRLQ